MRKEVVPAPKSEPAKEKPEPFSTRKRWIRFIDYYVTNGLNATQAAISAGYSRKHSQERARELLHKPWVKARIAQELEAAGLINTLSVDRTLTEIARIAYNNPGTLFDANGNIIRMNALTEDQTRCISSIDIEEIYEGKPEMSARVGRVKKIKFWDKNAALEKAMKFHKLYADVTNNNTQVNIIISKEDEDA